MRHGDGNPDPLRQLQQVCFPGPGATAIAATAIGANQQTSGRTIALSPIQPPPPPDTLHREFRRVVADPYVDHGPIVPDIIDPIGKDRKSTRLNSSHLGISYAVFCLKKKKSTQTCAALSAY